MTLGEPLGSSRMGLVARETNPVIRVLELFAPCPSNLQEGERHWRLSSSPMVNDVINCAYTMEPPQKSLNKVGGGLRVSE